MNARTIEILEPIAPLAGGERHLSPRPRSLAGLTLGILSTEGPNGRELLEELAAIFVARDDVRAVRHRSRHGGGDWDLAAGERVPAAAQSAAALGKTIDLAIAGVGL